MNCNYRTTWQGTRYPQYVSHETSLRSESTCESNQNIQSNQVEILENFDSNSLSYCNLYEYNPSITICLDLTGDIISINKFGADALGLLKEDLIGKSIFRLFPASEKVKLAGFISKVLQKSSVIRDKNWEFRISLSGSNISWVRINANLVDTDSANNYILIVLENITSYKQEQLNFLNNDLCLKSDSQDVILGNNDGDIRDFNRLKDEFLSTVSHELRTPLTNMKMAIQMLQISLYEQYQVDSKRSTQEIDLDKLRRYFNILDNECEREINLINNFLDLQRLDNSADSLVLETIIVDEWLTRILESFRNRERQKLQQHLYLDISPRLPDLVCDPFSLERIILELLTNACKYTPAEESITVRASYRSKGVEIEIINTGVEIPESELSKIFDKFYRIPSNDPWKQGGTGLGLALAKKLTHYLGGSIRVKSELNTTCFTVHIPVQEIHNVA